MKKLTDVWNKHCRFLMLYLNITLSYFRSEPRGQHRSCSADLLQQYQSALQSAYLWQSVHSNMRSFGEPTLQECWQFFAKNIHYLTNFSGIICDQVPKYISQKTIIPSHEKALKGHSPPGTGLDYYYYLLLLVLSSMFKGLKQEHK